VAEERIRNGRRNLARLLAATIAVTLAVAGAAWAAFPQDPPNDPEFAPAEASPAETTCLTKSGDNQEHYLFSKIPQCTPNAQDPEGSAGMFIDKAWRDFTTGNPQTTIAYIEGGINWHNEPRELANKVFLNAGELPAPTTAVNDGVLSAKDYADTPDSNSNGLVDPEDIIVRFSNGVDDDHNGYTDDISGWDFYNNQNDPATLDATYDHANGQMKQAAAQTNNELEGAGVCPDCRLLPVKAGAEALDRSEDLAQAWLYATDLHADVIVSTTADLGYSTFMSQAVEYAWNHGTAMVQSSNDFDSTDHQGGMFHQHVLPGNGMVANTHGMDVIPGTAAVQNTSTTTYRARSGYTSWGTHNMFTAATTGGTTSESTPTIGGVLGLVLAYGKQAAAQQKISGPLTPDEAIQVLRATASDVAAPVPAPINWPAKPGWDLQYGYGRPNVYKAMQAVSQNNIPPEAWIDQPRWYALFDPTQGNQVNVTGHVAARRSSGAHWTVQFAPGAEPEDSDFITAGQGQLAPNQHLFNGSLGTINLSQIPASFWNKAFTLSQRKELETNEAYTVTIRLRVFDAQGRIGEERRSIAVHHDPTLRAGFPRKIGPGGESQPVFADLQGSGNEVIIFGDSDGRVHALDGQGNELPGFPVLTNPTQVTRSHAGVPPGHEPLFTNLAVGDLDHNGQQWIVGASSAGRVYVWDSHGNRRPGWPKVLNLGVSKPSIPRPNSPFTRPPIMGATAPPVLADLDGDGKLEVIEAGWDGRLHAWRPNGQNLPGWPVEVTLPPGTTPPSGMVTINDHKLDLPPALAQLDDDPQPELVQRTQYSFTPGAGLQVGNAGRSNFVAYNSDGSRVPGFLISAPALAFYYGSAQEFVTEGVSDPATADLTGDGKTEIAAAPGIFSPTSLYNPDGSLRTIYGPNPLGSFTDAVGSLEAIQQTLQGNLPTDIPVNFATSGAFGNFGGGLAYTEPGSGAATVAGALLLSGSGLPINSYARAFNASTGASLAGFPSKLQGLDFLGAPAIADVSGDGQPDLLIGGDSSALHAYSAGTGGQASGFPKFHTGWEVFGPSVGDIDGDGRNEVAITTREGYVMVWNTPGRATSNDEWWSVRHDERNTGEYGIDTRSPGVAGNARIEGGQLRFKAPGDDWYDGRVDHYTVQFVHTKSGVTTSNVNPSGDAGSVQTVNLPPDTKTVRVRGVDEAGNLGGWVSVQH
jgi:VCBS repeat protein/subtilase family protein